MQHWRPWTSGELYQFKIRVTFLPPVVIQKTFKEHFVTLRLRELNIAQRKKILFQCAAFSSDIAVCAVSKQYAQFGLMTFDTVHVIRIINVSFYDSLLIFRTNWDFLINACD